MDNGKIIAVAEGTATITAKASGGQTATCTVTVNKKVQAFTWSVISQSDCPLNISNEFDNYILINPKIIINTNGTNFPTVATV